MKVRSACPSAETIALPIVGETADVEPILQKPTSIDSFQSFLITVDTKFVWGQSEDGSLLRVQVTHRSIFLAGIPCVIQPDR